MSNVDKRVGPPEKEVASQRISRAFSLHYLDDEDMQERLSNLAQAKTASEVQVLVYDLPPLEEQPRLGGAAVPFAFIYAVIADIMGVVAIFVLGHGHYGWMQDWSLPFLIVLPFVMLNAFSAWQEDGKEVLLRK